MTTLRLILGDQLSESISSLKGCDKKNDLILMCEVIEEATYVKHHKKKMAFIFSAMRHFAESLKNNGYPIIYTTLDDSSNKGSFQAQVEYICQQHAIKKIIVTSPSEYRVLKNMESWESHLKLVVEIREDDRFLCSKQDFKQWASGRKQLVMEYFYRTIRQRYNILMQGDKPEGGQWNYDSENRKPPKAGLNIPEPFKVMPDKITQSVIKIVSKYFNDHFGELEPFHFAVTTEQAHKALQHFIDHRLAQFGDYQDAMMEDEPWMFHAHLGFYLNCGLLNPMACVEAAEKAYLAGKAPLNATEGFIRQVIGWREYVRGIYWLTMPDYAKQNFLQATRNLPEFYWSNKTQMNCLHQCISETQKNAYAHHIQRLMVLGNFTLLTGISPEQVNEWFLVVYADAYEWVELPNVSGMVLFADGGYLASKPYASGGAYIHKMSNYCQNCHYNVKEKNGSNACPFNYLYWDFLNRNREKLSKNHRLTMMYKTYDRMSDEKKSMISADSNHFLEAMDKGKLI